MLLLLRDIRETVDSNVNSEWRSHRASNWKALANIGSVHSKENPLDWLGSRSAWLFPSLFPSASKSCFLWLILCIVQRWALWWGRRGWSIHLADTLADSAAFSKASLPILCVCTHSLHEPLLAWPMRWNPWTWPVTLSLAALVLRHFCD